MYLIIATFKSPDKPLPGEFKRTRRVVYDDACSVAATFAEMGFHAAVYDNRAKCVFQLQPMKD